VFAWPGVGWYAVQAIKSVDYPVVTSFTLIMCAIYAISNLLVDMSYAFFDPRIKHG
ncbi:MAG: ABC transporter permease subunit, partial [Armatimonadetes bacterium]|nr:ABC transporter permease subunit [Armatimonadota bacterium]